MITVEIAYAKPEKQTLLTILVEPNCTIEKAILQSGILVEFPEIDLNSAKVGIFSKSCTLNQPVQDGDRVEIYRPLPTDPKEMRRSRASAMK
ncbi:MAG: RnfH family protein [Methylococcales bacterium]|nr:RnfH family protein [Methylococcales bacterium]